MAVNLIYTVGITLIYVISLLFFYKKFSKKPSTINQIISNQEIINPVFTIVYEKPEVSSDDIPELAQFVLYFSKLPSLTNNNPTSTKEESSIFINKKSINFQKLKMIKL